MKRGRTASGAVRGGGRWDDGVGRDGRGRELGLGSWMRGRALTWLARAGRWVLLRREVGRALRWFGMPSEHRRCAWRGQAASGERQRAVCPPSERVHSTQETPTASVGLHFWSTRARSQTEGRTHNKGAGYLRSLRFSSSLPFFVHFLGERPKKPDFEGRVGLFPGMRNRYTAGLDGLEPILIASVVGFG